MTDFKSLEEEFKTYNPIVFDINSFEKIKIFDGTFDVQFSNNICT